MSRKFWLGLCLVVLQTIVFAQDAEVFGKITDENKSPLIGVIITAINSNVQAISNAKGQYSIQLPIRDNEQIRFQYSGYQSELYSIQLQANERKRLNVQLAVLENELGEAVVTASEVREKGGYQLAIEELKSLPAVSGGVETLIKTLPGVQSNNELSSQFAVRGGNYDENVLYINGIEIIRPQLIRSGQQEGLSIINSDLADDIYFSAGGFEAQYGDKLSSVLDIQYRPSDKRIGKAYVGFMGAGLALKNQTPNNFYYSVGGRYQTNQYLLNTLDEGGEYNPQSADVQALIGKKFNENNQLELLAIYNSTEYNFEPATRTTTFGSINNIVTFNAALRGQEVDDFGTSMVALSYKNQADNNISTQYNIGFQQNNESENIDFISRYLLGEMDDTGEIDTLANGQQTDIIKNDFTVNRFFAQHRGFYETANKRHFLGWGADVQRFQFKDEVDEFNQLLTVDENDVVTLVFEEAFADKNEVDNTILSGFLQDTWLPTKSENVSITAGARLTSVQFTDEFLISPRLQASFRPDWESDVVFKFASGLYQQYPFYREFKNNAGAFNENVTSQKSLHAIAGADINFTMGNLPFNILAEAYYKDYWDVVPYEYDGLRIRYLGDNLATAYATGLDFRLYGEFVEDAPSWLSLSFLKTEEEIEGQGKIARPTDQRVNASAYWQDYFPGNKNFRVNMVAIYGGALQTGIADGNRLNDDFKIPSYKRLDVGFSANLKGKKAARLPYSPFEKLNSIWLSAEVFNLFNIDNTSSYQWVYTPGDTVYAVPNYLTSRRLNAKLYIEF